MDVTENKNNIMQTYKVTVDDQGNIFWRNDKDQLHRLNGPAAEWADGAKKWWVDGNYMSEQSFNDYIKLKSPKPSCEGKVVEVDGIKYKLTAIKEDGK